MSKSGREKVSTIGLLLLFGVVIIYALFRLLPAIIGTKIALDPLETEGNITVISGIAKRSRELFINNLPIPQTEMHAFRFRVASIPGINRATLTSKDQFGHTDTRVVEWYYTSPNLLDVYKENTKSPEENGNQEASKESEQVGDGL